MTLSPYSLACLLTLLPVTRPEDGRVLPKKSIKTRPPGVEFEDSYLQLYPIDPMKCPDYDLGKDVTFELYTRNNPLTPHYLRLGDDKALEGSYMDFSRPTVMYLHAFFESSTAVSGNLIRLAYSLRGDHNLILLSARRLLAGPWYPLAVKNTYLVGLYAAQFIEYLYSRGLDSQQFHMVGLSLGAQVAGVAGAVLSRRPARITGLDPALPLFPKLPLTHRLDKTDAHFVDIIHTDAGILGISASMGHADFYINNGKSPQPGCDLKTLKPRMLILEKVFCSHWRSFQLYAQSILTPAAYPASVCDPRYKHSCELPPASSRVFSAYMGYGADPRIHGKFYVETTAVAPYTVDRYEYSNNKRIII